MLILHSPDRPFQTGDLSRRMDLVPRFQVRDDAATRTTWFDEDEVR